MIASDINWDKVGPDMSLEQLSNDYSQFLSTLSAGNTNPKINNVKDTCNYCGKPGHYEKTTRVHPPHREASLQIVISTKAFTKHNWSTNFVVQFDHKGFIEP